jgi:Cd2+/Zn2+-exporting ATPase
MAPETAQVKGPDGTERTARVERVPVGSVVAVRPGDRIPLDGVVVAGQSSVNQAPITGESVPADKAPGDAVYAGTINEAGYLEVKTTKVFAENTLSKIVHLVEAAQSEKAPSQRFVERFARVYTPAVVALAVLVAVVPPLLLGEPFAFWFDRALVLLLIACPCALVIATPVAVVAAIGNASRHGVLIKGGAYLERAGALRAVAFDKTGTLTRGVPEVQRVVPLNGMAEAEALRLTAAVEARSEHPLAEAVVRAARRRGLDALPAVQAFTAVTGSGVQATVAGTRLFVGKPAWLAAAGLSLAPAQAALDAFAAGGQTALVAASAPAGATAPQELVAAIAVADEVRPAAAEAVAALRRVGIERVVLLSGDHPATARAVGRQVGIPPEDVHGELLPEAKVAAIKALVASHKQVAMVGDGVNDAPALAAATVGIAMGAGGSDTALETADVALVADDLARVPWVLALSRRAAWTIKANVAFALLTKAAVIVLAALGYVNLWLAIATDVGATILVILNGMRLLGGASTEPVADVDGARRRYGLGEADAHAGHGH